MDAPLDAPLPIDAPLPVRLELALDREPAAGPDPILVDVRVVRGTEPQLGATVNIEAGAALATTSTVVERGDGHYTATVVPAITSGDLPIRVAALGAELSRTALVLPIVDDAWGQPEQVPGLVNTPGHEDSAELSPDGQWLIASTYSPIDLVCCLTAIPTICTGAPTAGDPASVACNTSLGPYAAPARPDLPGAERITSPTSIHDALPRWGLAQPPGVDLPFAVPPVAAYGFRRQPDGSFAEPFSIAFDADGVTTAPFGLTFAQLGAGGAATIIYAWDDLRTQDAADTANDLYRAAITLGPRVVLGTVSGGMLDVLLDPVPLATVAGPQGNPGVAPDGIFYDAEGGDLDLHFAAGDSLGTAPLAAAVPVGVNTAAAEYQPFFYAGRLYYSRDYSAVRSALRGAGDISLPGTWTDDHVELGVDGATDLGRVLSIGEPSLGDAGAGDELYFVYAVRTATGLNSGIGRVRRK